MVGPCHYTFALIHRRYNIKSEPQCRLQIRVVTRHQCRFISCNKRPSPVGDVDDGGGCAHMVSEDTQESLYLLLRFAVNLKLSRTTAKPIKKK